MIPLLHACEFREQKRASHEADCESEHIHALVLVRVPTSGISKPTGTRSPQEGGKNMKVYGNSCRLSIDKLLHVTGDANHC